MLKTVLLSALVLWGIGDGVSAASFGGARGTLNRNKKKSVCTKEETTLNTVKAKCDKLRLSATMAAPEPCQKEVMNAKAILDRCKKNQR